MRQVGELKTPSNMFPRLALLIESRDSPPKLTLGHLGAFFHVWAPTFQKF